MVIKCVLIAVCNSLCIVSQYLMFYCLYACSTEIEWYPGKCLTHKILKKKPKKGSKNTKPITKTEPCDSFFNFFNPPEVPEDDDDLDEEAVSS